MTDRFPTPAWLQEAMVFPGDCLIPSKLKTAVISSQIMGLPALSTGANSAVFKIELRGNSFALKCFTQADNHRNKRYRKLSKAIPKDSDTPFVDFEYYKKGLRFNRTKIPVLVYPWLDLPNIVTFVEDSLGQAEKLKKLAKAVLDLEKYLTQNEFAHGDLQHGNMFISEGSDSALKIRLIDYDQMYCYSLRRLGISEMGHRNYQHPDRNTSQYGPKMDRFSFVSIWLAIQALIEEPGLWSKYSNGENILFTQNDFLHTKSSKLLEELSSIVGLKEKVHFFKSICDLPVSRVPNLRRFVSDEFQIATKDVSSREMRSSSSFEKETFSTEAIEKSLTDLKNQKEQLEKRLEHHKVEMLSRTQEDVSRSAKEIRDTYLRKHSVGILETERIVSHKVVVRLKSFNLRNASDISQKSLDAIFGLAPETKSKILEWVDGIQSKHPSQNIIGLSRDGEIHADLNTKRIGDEIEQIQERIESLENELNEILDSRN